MLHFTDHGPRSRVGSENDDDSVFAEIVETVAPNSEDMVVLIKSYFDESYNDGLLCLAGYIFTSAKARNLDLEWKKMLARYKRLPYFRMSACNAHEDPFDRLSKAECISVATDAISLINQHAAFGCAVTVDQAAFNKIVTRKGFVSTPYEFCAWLCLTAVRSEIAKQFPSAGLSFFFEAGFQHQELANNLMNKIFNTPELRAEYNYRSHSFMDKIECCPIQAADLLAWQWYKDSIRRGNGETNPRGDLAALIKGTQHWTLYASKERLQETVDLINEKARALTKS